MLCRRHTGRNAPPFEGMDIIISLAVITYITVYTNEKPASAHSATTCAVQSSFENTADSCSLMLRQCPKWIKQDFEGLHISIFQSSACLYTNCILIPIDQAPPFNIYFLVVDNMRKVLSVH